MTVGGLAAAIVLMAPTLALAHEDQVIRFGSFLGGFTHPVLGLDHFLAMVSVGIVSAMIGGRAIWSVPGLFVTMMAVGGTAGRADLGLGAAAIEAGIAISVIALGLIISIDRRVPTGFVMSAIVFFGFFHGYAHGVEIPNVARPGVYAAGFLTGTALIHLLGVLAGLISDRYQSGRLVLRTFGALFVLLGALFIVGVM